MLRAPTFDHLRRTHAAGVAAPGTHRKEGSRRRISLPLLFGPQQATSPDSCTAQPCPALRSGTGSDRMGHRTLAMCVLTVSGLRPKRTAISAFLPPLHSSSNTRCSPVAVGWDLVANADGTANVPAGSLLPGGPGRARAPVKPTEPLSCFEAPNSQGHLFRTATPIDGRSGRSNRPCTRCRNDLARGRIFLSDSLRPPNAASWVLRRRGC